MGEWVLNPLNPVAPGEERVKADTQWSMTQCFLLSHRLTSVRLSPTRAAYPHGIINKTDK